VSRSRRLRKLEDAVRSPDNCPCQAPRQLELVEVTQTEVAARAAGGPSAGFCPRCGRAPRIARIVVVRPEGSLLGNPARGSFEEG
jgi:hypothetical protein